MTELHNFVHPRVIDEASLEVTMLDNIAHELNRLNKTMSFISETLLCMGKYFQSKE